MPPSRSESGLAPAEVGQLLLSSAADRRGELITEQAASRHTTIIDVKIHFNLKLQSGNIGESYLP
jgi:hypothetical protein